MREFVANRFGQHWCRSSCLNYLHRLGFVLKRPKKRLLKVDPEKRDAFVTLYAALPAEAQAQGAKIFFVDEGLFRGDADLRGKWVLKGEPALVDSTSPALLQKGPYYSVVCLETGEVATMEVEGNCTAATSLRFLRQLREQHAEPLIVGPSAPWRGGAGVPGDAGPEAATCALAPVPPGLQRRRGHLGLGSGGGHPKHLSGDQGEGPRAGGSVPGKPERACRRGQAALSHDPASPS